MPNYPTIKEVIDGLDSLDDLPRQKDGPPFLESGQSRIGYWWSYLDYYRLELWDLLCRFGVALTLWVCAITIQVTLLIDPWTGPIWQFGVFMGLSVFLTLWSVYIFLDNWRNWHSSTAED